MPIVNVDEFAEKKYTESVNIECDYCGNISLRTKDSIVTSAGSLYNVKNVKLFCNSKCHRDYNIQQNYTECHCQQCKRIFAIKNSRITQGEGKFCSQSCAATYNNTHKTHGYRRSKLEAYIESRLNTEYSQLTIDFNKKDAINSELDIYIPSLKLAFELNGIFHYEPIYSEKQLQQTQNNDQRKFQACLERQIELCVIDTCQLKYFKPSNAEKYYIIVKQILDEKLASLGLNQEPTV